MNQQKIVLNKVNYCMNLIKLTIILNYLINKYNSIKFGLQKIKEELNSELLSSSEK